MAKKFKRGHPISSITSLVIEIEAGHWLFLDRKPIHPSIIVSMTLHTILGALKVGRIHEAIDKTKVGNK